MLFPADGVFDVVEALEIYQMVNIILLGEILPQPYFCARRRGGSNRWSRRCTACRRVRSLRCRPSSCVLGSYERWRLLDRPPSRAVTAEYMQPARSSTSNPPINNSRPFRSFSIRRGPIRCPGFGEDRLEIVGGFFVLAGRQIKLPPNVQKVLLLGLCRDCGVEDPSVMSAMPASASCSVSTIDHRLA